MLLIVHNWCNLIACNVCMHAHIYVLHADTRLCNVQGLRFRSKRFGFEGHRSEIRPQNWFWPITPKRAKFLQKIVNQCCESWNTKKKQNKMSDFLRSKQRTGKGRRKMEKREIGRTYLNHASSCQTTFPDLSASHSTFWLGFVVGTTNKLVFLGPVKKIAFYQSSSYILSTKSTI